MKRYAVCTMLFFLITLAATAASALQVLNSKHDLSSGSTASVKSSTAAGGTDQICVFCHTPHNAKSDAPLWNKTSSTAVYLLYNKAFSDVLANLGGGSYPDSEDPSNSASLGYAQHAKTRICLSCHDGTIALGSLVNLPAPLVSNVTMQGPNLTADYRLTSGSASYLGTDLTDDHPVAIQYQSGALAGKDPELILPVTGNVRLYGLDAQGRAVSNATTNGSNGSYVECTSCHNAHDNQYGSFLVGANDGSKLCFNCHKKSLGSIANNAHDNATTVGYNPPTGASAPNPATYGTFVSDVKCMTCHYMHRAGATGALSPFNVNPGYGKYLLSFQEDTTCFNTTNRWGQAVSACHASNTTNASGRSINIQTQFSKANSGHSASKNANYSGKHGAMEQGNGAPASLPKIPNTHVVCSDCHNSHTAGNGPLHSAGTNTISTNSALYGAGGVQFLGPLTAWTSPATGIPASTNYSAYEPLGATNSTSVPASYYEYQICLKCHSNFAWGGAGAPAISDLAGITNMTDQLREFNNSNPSYHPVIGTINAANSYAPPSASWVNGWSATRLMYCSDCHGNNTTVSEAQGPHGSTNKGILVKAFDDTYGTVNGAAQSNNDLCFNCHAYSVYGQAGANTPNNLGQTGFSTVTSNINLHTQHAYREIQANPRTIVTNPWSYKCVNCHARVSHGYLRRGMVVMQNDGPAGSAAYEAGGANTAPISSSSLPASPGANLYGTAINSNCTIQAGVTGCHHN